MGLFVFKLNFNSLTHDKNNNTWVPLPQIQYLFFLFSLRTHVRIMEAVHQVQIPVVFVQAVWSLVIYLTVDSVYLHLMLIYHLCGHAVSLPLNWMQCATHVYFHCLQDHSYLSQKGPQRNPKGRCHVWIQWNPSFQTHSKHCAECSWKRGGYGEGFSDMKTWRDKCIHCF